MYSLKKFFRKNIFFTCFLLSSLILGVKIYVIPDSFEFIEPISIYTALLSSVIFIYGFMMSPAIAEFKESERLRTELRATIENILSDIDYFTKLKPTLSIQLFQENFSQVLELIFERIANNKKEGSIHILLSESNSFLLEGETLGIPANHIIKVKQEVSSLRKIVTRIFFIKDSNSLPAVIHNLKNFITLFIITTLMFLNIGDAQIDTMIIEIKEGIVIFILSFIYMYLSFIINSLENPFDKRNFSGYIDVSFLKEYVEILRKT